eukprot:TRINITY_DN3459_c1_g1_i2.p2 TRINITY_DN3459_c1_g1~~TRINITY_DN3459_c1_g1_i2.p2  ORF type:complete len:105 (-),score=10.51 TRINITY_DN3459_c1_g1_i2:143-457(-)
MHVQLQRLYEKTAFFHGCEDCTAPFSESVELHNLLDKSGISSEIMLYPRGHHVEYVLKWRKKQHDGIARECSELVKFVKLKTMQKVGTNQKQLSKKVNGLFKKM